MSTNERPKGVVALNSSPTPAMLATRFRPGNCANPGGRPKGLEARVRELVDFDKITLMLRDIALGEMPPGVTSESGVKIKDRIEAAKLLYDRGFGKARAVVDLTTEIAKGGIAGVDIDALDATTLALLDESIERALTGRAIDVTPDKSGEVLLVDTKK